MGNKKQLGRVNLTTLERRLEGTNIRFSEESDGILLTIVENKKDDWKYLVWTIGVGCLALYIYLKGASLHAVPPAVLCFILLFIFFNNRLNTGNSYLQINEDVLTYSNEDTSYRPIALPYVKIKSIIYENHQKTLFLFFAQSHYVLKVFGVGEYGIKYLLLSTIELQDPSKAASSIQSYLQDKLTKAPHYTR